MIHMTLPYLAPTVNHVYMHIRKGNKTLRVLTAEGRKFKKEAEAHLTKTYPLLLAGMKKDTPYSMFFKFTVTDLVNKGWAKGETARYKRHDVSNRIKVLEDVIVEVTAVDDANYMTVACQKVQGEEERTDIYIWNLEKEGSPFDAAALSL